MEVELVIKNIKNCVNENFKEITLSLSLHDLDLTISTILKTITQQIIPEKLTDVKN